MRIIAKDSWRSERLGDDFLKLPMEESKKSLTGSEQKTKLIDHGHSPNNTETAAGPM